MMSNLYKHNLPFSTGLDTNIKHLVTRVDNKKASMIIIDGGLGEGKTTLMIHVLDYINSLKGLPPIDINGPQLALGGVDFLKKLRVCFDDKLPCIGYDEAGDFSRRGSLTNFNAMINRTFETFRAFKCVVVIALPNFYVLDQELIDKNIPRLLLHLKNRNERQGNYYGYSLYRIQLLKARMNKLNIKNFAYTTVWANFYGHFLDLDRERSTLLDKVSSKNKLDVLRKAEVRIEGLLTYNEMATKLFKSIDWCRKAVANLKLKPTRVINKVKYFDLNTLNQLVEHSEIIGDTRWRNQPGRERKVLK